jgi:hypothetical protein
MADHSQMRLGKAAPRHDPRTLQFASYLQTNVLPEPPASTDYTAKVTPPWGMMENDRYGDCTCAAAGHLIVEWSANAGTQAAVGDDAVIKAYSDITGFDPKTGANDNGAVEVDVLNYWRKTGVGGHQIMAYAALEPGNANHVKDAIELFGGCYIGLALPITAQTQDVWAVPPGGPTGDGAPRSWGGHAVPVVAYDARGCTCVTWGDLKQMTWQFWNTYCDEAYAVLSGDFLTTDKDGKVHSPHGFDLAALETDLKAVVG